MSYGWQECKQLFVREVAVFDFDPTNVMILRKKSIAMMKMSTFCYSKHNQYSSLK